MASLLNTDGFNYFLRGEPVPGMSGPSSTAGFDYFLRKEPFQWIIAGAAAFPRDRRRRKAIPRPRRPRRKASLAWLPPSSSVSGADTFTFTEAVALAGSNTDTSVLTDTAQAGPQGTDAAAMAEVTSSAGLSGNDTGAGSETGTVSGQSTDASVLTETSATAGPANSDAVAFAESSSSLAQASIDAGSLTEAAAAGLVGNDAVALTDTTISLTATLTGADASSLAESPIAGPAGADSATLADASTSLTATFTAVDLGTLAEAAGITATLASTDAVFLADLATVTPFGADAMVFAEGTVTITIPHIIPGNTNLWVERWRGTEWQYPYGAYLTMIPSTLVKRAGETRLYDFDFSRQAELAAGQVLATMVSLVASRSGLTIATDQALTLPIPPNQPVMSATRAQVWIAGGVAGTVYTLTMTVLTSGGAQISLDGILEVVP